MGVVCCVMSHLEAAHWPHLLSALRAPHMDWLFFWARAATQHARADRREVGLHPEGLSAGSQKAGQVASDASCDKLGMLQAKCMLTGI